jgi:hypothetical protein
MNRIVVPAHLDHIDWIARNMSDADRAEIAASAGISPRLALVQSLEASAAAWTGLVGDSRPVCMFGVSPIDILGGVGCPWLLTTEELPRHAKTFLKLNREYVPKMLDVFPHLVNWVDVRHEVAIRWLKWLGFRFDENPVAYGPYEMPFLRFTMEKKKLKPEKAEA